MIGGEINGSLAVWEDYYERKPKKRILKEYAKAEIQRAWDLWVGDKSSNLSMFTFFAWFTRYRPYFITFRGRGDHWQTVHSWLLQHERNNNHYIFPTQTFKTKSPI